MPETATAPTKPVNKRVNKGLSEVLNLRVMINKNHTLHLFLKQLNLQD